MKTLGVILGTFILTLLITTWKFTIMNPKTTANTSCFQMKFSKQYKNPQSTGLVL